MAVKNQGGMKPPHTPPQPHVSPGSHKGEAAKSVQKQGVRVPGIGGSGKSF